MINESFEDEIFPSELEIPKILPIFKSGDKLIIENYRSISILSVLHKFEKEI